MGIFKPIERTKNVNILVYGAPGCGKTTMLGSAVDGTDEKMALIDCEGGTSPIDTIKNIYVAHVKTYDEVLAAYKEIENAVRSNKIQWIAIDTLTELQDLFMQEVKTEKIRSSSGIREVVRDRARMDDWGITIGRLKTIVRMFRDLPVNTIFTAHKKSDKNESEETCIKPAFDGTTTSDIISGFCDVVLYMRAIAKTEDDKITIHRFCTSAPTGNFVAKDRFSVLDQNEAPDLREIVKKIMQRK